MEIPAHLVNKSAPVTKQDTKQSAKDFVKSKGKALFKIQKQSKVSKRRLQKVKEIHPGSKTEKRLIEKMAKRLKPRSKKAQKKSRKQKGKNAGRVLDEESEDEKFMLAGGVKDIWGKPKSKLQKEKPSIKNFDVSMNPAVMVPHSGESYNPSNQKYQELVDNLFDKGKPLTYSVYNTRCYPRLSVFNFIADLDIISMLNLNLYIF